MKTSLRHIVWTAYAVLVLLLASRTAWVASHAETGWETLSLQWKDATLGWFVGRYVPICQRDPVEQAEFWLGEVERIVDANPDDAALAMGAACILDAPGEECLYVAMRTWGDIPWHPAHFRGPDLDGDALEESRDRFESLCKDRCMELAARATELEPSNVDWWRCRAFLQRRDWTGDIRDSRWLDTLEECAEHDPGNALCDYFIAEQLWREGLESVFEGNDYRLKVSDMNRFDLGTEHYELGLRKDRCVTGDAPLAAVRHFLARSRLPLREHPHVATEPTGLRIGDTLAYVQSVQRDRAVWLIKKGNPLARVDLLTKSHRIAEQIQPPDGPEQSKDYFLDTDCATLASLRTVFREYPGLISGEEEARISEDYVEEVSACEILRRARREVQSLQVSEHPRLTAWLLDLLHTDLAALMSLLAVTSGLSWVIATTLLMPSAFDLPTLGPRRCAVVCTASLGATFALFGLGPAEIISHRVQGWIALGLIGLFVAGLAAAFLWRMYRRRFQFSLRGLLGFSLGVAVVCSLLAWWRPGIEDIRGLPEWLHLRVLGWEGVDAGQAMIYGELYQKPWALAIVQWRAYSGPIVGAILGLLVVVVWHTARSARLHSRTIREYGLSNPRQCIGGMFHELSKSAGALAACCLLFCLIVTPRMINSTEAVFQSDMAFFRNPEQYYDSVRAEIAKIKADPVAMASISAEIEDWMQRSEEGEAAE